MEYSSEIIILVAAATAGAAHSVYGRSMVRILADYVGFRQYHPAKKAVLLLLQGQVSACMAVPVALAGFFIFDFATTGGYWNGLLQTPSFYLTVSSISAYTVWGVGLWFRSHPHLHMHFHPRNTGHSGFYERIDNGAVFHEHTHSHLGEHTHFHSKTTATYMGLGFLSPSATVVPVVIFAILTSGIERGLAAAMIFGATESLVLLLLTWTGLVSRIPLCNPKYVTFFDFSLIAITCAVLAFEMA